MFKKNVFILHALSLCLFSHASALFAEDNSGTLLNLQRLTYDRDSIAPAFSPQDGTMLAFTKQKYQGLYLLQMKRTLAAGEHPVAVEKTLRSGNKTGFGFSWAGNGKHIVFREDQEAGAQAGMVDVRTNEFTPLSEVSEEVSTPTANQQGIFFSQSNQAKRLPLPGMRQSAANLTPPIVEDGGHITVNGKLAHPETEQCWLPQLSPDGSKLSMECWGGLFVYVLKTQQRHFLDAGTSASWAADSTHLVYEQTQDDGHSVTASDVFYINYDGSNKILLSGDLKDIVRRPSLSPDQRKLAIDINDDIYLADIQLSGAP